MKKLLHRRTRLLLPWCSLPALLAAQQSRLRQSDRAVGPGHPDWRGQTMQIGTPPADADAAASIRPTIIEAAGRSVDQLFGRSQRQAVQRAEAGQHGDRQESQPQVDQRR